MNQKNVFNTATSFLLVTVLVVLAFIRGQSQIWLLVGAFAVWGVWIITALLFCNKTAIQAGIRAHQQKKHCIAKSNKTVAASQDYNTTEIPDFVGLVLLRHVSYRISIYLKSVYPDVTWEWCEDTPPETIIAKGGTARIRLSGVPDFNFADVMFDQHANIDCDMLRIVPLAQLSDSDRVNETVRTPLQETIDPAVWYDLQGRQVLENVVADLNVRGYSRLTIRENGEICIRQDDADVEREKFKKFPAKVYWSGIVKVLENAGLAATVEDNGIVVSW
jgi:hypothetical protein